MTNFNKQIKQELIEGEMPFLIITCGDNRTKIPHGKIEIARFFDSRFEDFSGYGRSLPRLDIPARKHTDEFTWDCYRLDIGQTALIPGNKTTPETRAATGYKSGERVWDTPEKIWLECRKQVSSVGRNGEIVKKQCKQRTQISREDWNEVGEFLIQNGLVRLGERNAPIEWDFLFQLVNAIKKRRKNN